jgi:hypothetical protein
VVGYHVTKQEFEAGKQFNGIIRLAAPVFDSTGFAGVVSLALDFTHFIEFTGHIVPTEPVWFSLRLIPTMSTIHSWWGVTVRYLPIPRSILSAAWVRIRSLFQPWTLKPITS